MTFRLDHVQLAIPAKSEGICQPFWVALGFAEIEKPESLRARGGAWFRQGAVELHLGVDKDFTPATKAHPAFATDRLDELVAALQAIDAPVRWDTTIPDRRRFFTADPVGNRIEFMEE